MSVPIEVGDTEWFDLQFDPALATKKYGVALPSFPDEATQISFTGRSGRLNLQQAFSFYLYVRANSGIGKLRQPRILDFGAGWGRIARFFLRDARPQDFVAADTMNFAISCMREVGSPFQIIQNPPFPPIPGFQQRFHLIYAFSVFSHLSEKYSRAWLDYLLTLLEPDGHLIFTTRGERFISDLAQIRDQSDDYIDSLKVAGVGNYLRVLRETFPAPEVIRSRLAAGEFQFYHVGHGELSDDCTGETLIPRRYLETHYRRYFVSISEDVPDTEQAVVVLKKPAS